MTKLKQIIQEEVSNFLRKGKIITLYRGIGYNEGNNFYSPSKAFAMEFTRSGRESELRTFKANIDKIYKHNPLPRGYGMEDPNFDLAIKTAQEQGYNAIWVDEGNGQPNSVFVITPSKGINEGRMLHEQTYKVYHGTNQQFDRFDFSKATQGIVWFTDSIDSIKNQEHGGNGNKFIMTRYITINKPAGWEEYEKYGLGQLEDMGYDGVILPQGNKTDYFVFTNKSIRKAGPKELQEEEDYRGSHTAPGPNGDDSPMNDLTMQFGEDIYGSQAVRMFGGYGESVDRYSIALIQHARNKPNMQVKIYRAVPSVITNQDKIADYEKRKKYVLKTGRLPRDVNNFRNSSEYYDWLSNEIERLKSLPVDDNKVAINPGDWVTINPMYTKQHGQSNLNNKFKVLSKTVRANQLYTDGNSIHEWGYNG